MAALRFSRGAKVRAVRIARRAQQDDVLERLHGSPKATRGSASVGVTPSPLAQLQSSAGNRAVSRSLAAAGHTSGPAPIMRYPSSVLEAPIKNNGWKKQTATVKKSGEGVSGGVYFFTSKRGKVKNIVVKAEDRSAEEKDTAGSLLASAGVSVPKGRNVALGSPEGADIVAAAAKRGSHDLTVTGQGGSQNTTFLEVMGVASGMSLSSKAKQAGTGDANTMASNIDQLIGLLATSNMQAQLADLMARDAILGNTDRVTRLGELSNIGNIMVSEAPEKKALPRALQSRVTAIDNEVDLTKGSFSLKAAKIALAELGTNPAAFIERLLGSISLYLSLANPQAGPLFEGHAQYGAVKAGLTTALKKAAMKEALLGTRKPATEPEKPFDAELRRRRMILWNILSG